jgi:hypothetical protein
MYPKQTKNNLNESTDFKKQAKREQLATLLITKFRNKYQINLMTERKLADAIHEQVNKMVLMQDSLSEKQLQTVDQMISQLVSDYRGPAKPSS